MANSFYALGAQAILNGSINFGSDTIKAALVKSAYTPNLASDQFYSTISSNVLGSPVQLTSVATTGGILTAANVTQSSVTTGNTIGYVVIYKDTGSSSTSPLICIFDTMFGLPYSTNGGDFTALWPSGQVFSIF